MRYKLYRHVHGACEAQRALTSVPTAAQTCAHDVEDNRVESQHLLVEHRALEQEPAGIRNAQCVRGEGCIRDA